MTVLIRLKYCGNAIGIATAATAEAKRKPEPRDAAVFPH